MEGASELIGGTLRKDTEGASALSSEISMSTTDASAQTLLARPKRADARRNYEKVLAAARQTSATSST